MAQDDLDKKRLALQEAALKKKNHLDEFVDGDEEGGESGGKAVA